MTSLPISTAWLASPPDEKSQAGSKLQDAAQQFEALLIGQLLRSARESGGGWLGGEDLASDSATEFAEQQLAILLAKQGGLGLAALIRHGLETASPPATPPQRGSPAGAALPR
jgi:flagellar protein FlgJ